MIRFICLIAVVVFITALPHLAASQSLSINTDGTTANASAMLDVKSLTKGLLIPRMSRTERDAIIAPATGLMIFQNAPDSIGFYYYNGSSWTWLLSNSNADSLAWKTRGNAGTTAANNFIGTTDNVPLVFRVNNAEKMRITPGGNVGIGVPAPAVALDVAGSATFGTGNVNTGTKSIVLGSTNTLSGNYSIATGTSNILSGNNSIASGESNTLSAIRSIVTGLGNVVAGENNIAGGYHNYIPAPYAHSIVVGQEDTVTASASAVFGYLNKITAYTGFAAGAKNLVSGQNSTAIGYEGMVSGFSGFITGSQDTAYGNNAAVFGTGNYGASYSEMSLGMYGTKYAASSISNYNPADRVFNVGIGISQNLRADAFTILKSGNVGIGTATPTSKLQVVGLPVYANNAAAISGGLTAGAFYRTGADPDLVCVVH